MDALLARLGAQAMNMAIRSGLALTSTYAVSQCSRLMKTVDDRDVRSELKRLQTVLDSKIKVVSPAIDLIEFKSGRGNAFLESALPLAKGLHQEMAALGRRVEQAAQAGEAPKGLLEVNQHGEHQLEELKAIISDMKSLLVRIDRDIPLLHMAITASGESLNSSMSPSISPSRLLQAGMFLTFGDTQYAADPFRPVQIGPAFTLSLYMLFVGHAAQYPGTEHKRPSHPPDTPCTPQREEPRQYGFKEGDRKPLWQEAIHKARVRLCRTPMDYAFDSENGFHSATSTNRHFKTDRMFGSGHHPLGQHNGYAYHLEVVEDLDDGRVHDEVDAQTSPYDDIDSAGIRESIPIHQISKIFYADTGRILNVGNDGGFDSNPVLLLKRDMSSKPPSHLEEEIVACTNDEVSDAGSVTGRALEEEEDQEDIDRQLREESAALDMLKELPGPKVGGPRLRFPCHLDPEWIALEVFEEDDVESSETEDDDLGEHMLNLPTTPTRVSTSPSPVNDLRTRARPSLDSRLVAQIQRMSLHSSPSPLDAKNPSPSFNQHLNAHSSDSTDSFVQRSPFGAVTTSLSLLEMLIRLTSLQEFQQASHLTIPDHVLTFFLEETSTTGLKGEEQLRARTEAKRRVGFDPYTDTPSR